MATRKLRLYNSLKVDGMMNRWLLLVGVSQGWLLWLLWKTRELKVWPAIDPSSERALLYIFLALPLAFYLTQNIETLTRYRRTRILVVIGTLFALLGGYSGWAENIQIDQMSGAWSTPPARPSDLLAAAVLGFVAIPLMVHFESSPKRWSYQALFETAWRNALMTVSSIALTNVFWIVLFAGAMLMKSISLNFIFDLIEKPIFFIPVTGIIFGTAFALSLAKSNMIVTLRCFWLTISAWLLPLLMLFSVMWVIALPFTGLEPLFKTHNAGFILLWFLALSISFANAAYQEGTDQQPYGAWLSKVLEYVWPSLLVLAAVAWWSLQQRISQYGWTEDRVWGMFVLLLATLYVAGYSYSVRLGYGWLVNIGKTNIVTALVMCFGLVLLLSPLADARRIAVHSQMTRLMNGAVKPEAIDYAYLRWEAGRYGQAALEKLSLGIEHQDKDIIASGAKKILAQKNRYSTTNSEELTAEQMRLSLRVLPKGAVLDEGLIKQMKAATRWEEKRCLETNAQCIVWMIDLNNDGLKEAVVIGGNQEKWLCDSAIFYHQVSQGQYKFGGTVELFHRSNDKKFDSMLSEIEASNFKTLPPKFSDIEIGGQRIKVNADSSLNGTSFSCGN